MAIKRLGSILLETFILVCCVQASYLIRFHASPLSMKEESFLVLKALLIAIIFQLVLHLRGVNNFRSARSMPVYFIQLAEALLIGSAVLWVLYYLVPDLLVGRGVFGIVLLLSALFLAAWRTMLRLYLRYRPPRTNLLVLGTGGVARELVREILRRPELGVRVRGFVDDNPACVGISVVNPKVVGLYTELPQLVASHNIDHIVIGLEDRRGRLPLKELLDLKTRGIVIEEAASLYERVTGKIAVENLKPSWMIFNSGFQISSGMLLLKRFLSIITSAVILILFAPVLLLVMVLIKLDSPGSIFHRQQRVGQDGKVFTLWKFRSMCKDAERDTGPVWAEEDDPRITRVGRFLRHTRLDEFPQLFNVFRGDMSLIGPRPERPCFVEELAAKIPYYQLRHAVKPGLTGWAQINYGYTNSIEQTFEKLQYDLFYIKNMSLLLDGIIVLKTIKTILLEKGS